MIENNDNEQKYKYAVRQQKRFERRAKYSLDNDNKRVCQARAEQWQKKEQILAEQTSKFTIDDSEQKFYKPVVYGGEEKVFDRTKNGKKVTVKTHKTTGINDIYISDKVKLKRKRFHQFDKDVTKVYELLGKNTSENKPKICILSSDEMCKNAVASYAPTQNILNINSIYFTTNTLSELQKDFTCPNNRLSTILHELVHWEDAVKYREKFGNLTDYNAYCEYLNKIYAPKVEKLISSGYNISDINKYAKSKFFEKEFDEVYDEYRVKQILQE